MAPPVLTATSRLPAYTRHCSSPVPDTTLAVTCRRDGRSFRCTVAAKGSALDDVSGRSRWQTSGPERPPKGRHRPWGGSPPRREARWHRRAPPRSWACLVKPEERPTCRPPARPSRGRPTSGRPQQQVSAHGHLDAGAAATGEEYSSEPLEKWPSRSGTSSSSQPDRRRRRAGRVGGVVSVGDTGADHASRLVPGGFMAGRPGRPGLGRQGRARRSRTGARHAVRGHFGAPFEASSGASSGKETCRSCCGSGRAGRRRSGSDNGASLRRMGPR